MKNSTSVAGMALAMPLSKYTANSERKARWRRGSSKLPEPTFGALVAAAGLVVIVVCYIGVNLLGIGLHSYGWFFDS